MTLVVKGALSLSFFWSKVLLRSGTYATRLYGVFMAVARRGWTRNEQIIALYLYGELPFGSFHKGNALVQQFSKLIDRTPSALAMKLSNFASLDPKIISSGRKGLGGASAADREIWSEMNKNWTRFVVEMQDVVSAFSSQVGLLASHEFADDDLPVSFIGKNKQAKSASRIGQDLFRKFVLSSYNYQCCISKLSVPRLLVASHIIPWKDDESNRLNPKNGLCLSMIHDKAFDLGMLTVTEDLKVRVSQKYHSKEDQFFLNSLSSFDGKSLILPNKFCPDQDFLAYHRDVIFESKVSFRDRSC